MRILVAEDNKKLATSLKKGLEQEGYSVDCVHDGLEAEEMARSFADVYDALVLDIMMPGKDGLAVCGDLRDTGITTPVIMLTARDGVDDRILGLDSGADDYLVKPFAFAELAARIRALLRRPRDTVSAKLRCGDLALDSRRRSVTIGDEKVDLTVKEFQLLEMLMRHAGQVLSRQQIINHLWDFEADLFSNSVDVHVKNLRKKLSGRGHAHTIETVRGVGYRFTE